MTPPEPESPNTNIESPSIKTQLPNVCDISTPHNHNIPSMPHGPCVYFWNHLESFLWEFNGLEKDYFSFQRLWGFWYWANFHKRKVQQHPKSLAFPLVILGDLKQVQNTRPNSIKVTRTTLKQLEQSIEEIQTSVADLIARLMESIVKVYMDHTVWPILHEPYIKGPDI